MTGRFRPCVRKVIRSIVLTCLGGLLPTAAVGQTIIWTDADARRIQKKDVNGGEIETIVQFPSFPTATQIHYDPIAAKLYYRRGFEFQRINLDGSDPENIPTPSVGTFTLNVDLRKLYWINSGQPSTLYRSELDGTGVQSHTYPSCCIVTVEGFGDAVYIGAGNLMNKGIWRADADGSNEQFLHGAPSTSDLSHDPLEKKIYVASPEGMYRMNIDGTGFDQIGDGTERIVVDYRGRKVYFVAGNVIRRSNLDGTNVQDFVTAGEAGNPNLAVWGLTVVYTYTPIPAVSGLRLIVMGSILLGAGIFVLRKRRLTQCEGTTDGQQGR